MGKGLELLLLLQGLVEFGLKAVLSRVDGCRVEFDVKADSLAIRKAHGVSKATLAQGLGHIVLKCLGLKRKPIGQLKDVWGFSCRTLSLAQILGLSVMKATY